MNAPTCPICDYTGSKSRYIGGDLDCTACDAVEKRLALRGHLLHYTAWPIVDNLAWVAYQFALAQQAPAVANAAQTDERAAFEAWCKGRDTGVVRLKGTDQYIVAEVQAAWVAWKGRAAIAAAGPNAAITEDQISKAARYLSDFTSSQCGVDKDDAWKVYGNDEINLLRDALVFAGVTP